MYEAPHEAYIEEVNITCIGGSKVTAWFDTFFCCDCMEEFKIVCLDACLIGLGILVATCLKSWCMLGRKDHGRLGLCVYPMWTPHKAHNGRPTYGTHPWPSKWLVRCALISPMTCRPSVINEALMVSGDGLSPQPLNLFRSMLFNTTWDVSKQCSGSIWA